MRRETCPGCRSPRNIPLIQGTCIPRPFKPQASPSAAAASTTAEPSCSHNPNPEPSFTPGRNPLMEPLLTILLREHMLCTLPSTVHYCSSSGYSWALPHWPHIHCAVAEAAPLCSCVPIHRCRRRDSNPGPPVRRTFRREVLLVMGHARPPL